MSSDLSTVPAELAGGLGTSAAVLDGYDRALMQTFGRPKRVFVRGEGCYVWDADGRRHLDLLAGIAGRLRLRIVATGNVHYARPQDRPLQTALAAVRARRSLDEMDGWLPAASGAHLRSGAEMAERFSRYPGSVENTVRVADEIAFELG